MQVKKTNRQPWIDALRAFAMILVVYGHCSRWDASFFQYTTAIKIPLFFIISGYLFTVKDKTIYFISYILHRLIVPWISLGIISVIPQLFIKGLDFLGLYVFRMFTGEVLWFMPCFIFAQIIWFVLNQYSKSITQLYLLSLFTGILGLTLSFVYPDFRGVAYFQSLTVQVFFSLGHFFRRNEERITKINSWIPITGLCIYIVFCYLSNLFFENLIFDIHLGRYYNYPYCFFLIVIGCFSLFSLGRKIYYAPKWLAYIGKNTLIVYILHEGFSVGISLALKSLGLFKFNAFSISIFIVVSAVSLCCVMSYLLNKYMPSLVGLKNRKR